MIISVNTLHFIPVPIDIYFFTFVKQTLLQQMRKWILWEAASPSWLQQLSFSFIPSVGPWCRGQVTDSQPRDDASTEWNSSLGAQPRALGWGEEQRAHGEMMRWGGGGTRNTEYSLQSSAHSMYSLLSPSAQVSPNWELGLDREPPSSESQKIMQSFAF